MRADRSWILLAACLLSVGCDIPTEAPILEQRWVLPLDEVTLDQSELLPPEVRISGDLYDVTVPSVAASESLGNLCPACAAFDGMTIPSTPAYSGQITSVDNLPADVTALAIASGAVEVTITNGLSFDPIAGGGSIAITIQGATGGVVLGSITFDGATESLTAGAVVTRTMFLTGATVSGGFRTTVDINSVGGQAATIDVDDEITLGALTTSLLASSATVVVDGTTASLSEEALDVEDLDADMLDAIDNGTAVLEVANPFGLTFTGSLTVGAVTKSVDISSTGTSTVLVSFSGDELRSFLGQPSVTMSGFGTIGGGPALVTPDATLAISPSIDLTVQFGG